MNKNGHSDNSRAEALSCGLSQALILKKTVSAKRFQVTEMDGPPVSCPRNCHACCSSEVALDLTAVESLAVYLLNREMVGLVTKHLHLRETDGYCPFLLQQRCMINTYKPSACQMYMPFAYQGGPMCYYLARQQGISVDGDLKENYMNSSCYDIHGCMMLIQCSLDEYLEQSFFRHIWQGVSWWDAHYSELPDETRRCLESILEDGPIGTLLTNDLKYGELLRAGQDKYLDMLAHKPGA